MNRRSKKLMIGILLVLLIGSLVFYAGVLFFDSANYHGELATGDKNVLVCIVDEIEHRPGMGACDMAFILHLENGTFKNISPVFPHGMTHPTKEEPYDAQAQGAGSQLLLHDAFWTSNNQQSLDDAKEIVEYNENVSIDGVAAVNAEALTAILREAGDISVGNETFTPDSFDIIGQQSYSGGNGRNASVMSIVRASIDKAKDPSIKSAMVQAAFSQYSQGHIVITPKGGFTTLLYMKGLENMN